MTHRYRVPPESRRGTRADKVLAAAFPEHSRVAIQRAFDSGGVLRNGERITKSAGTAPGDELVWTPPEAVPSELTPNPIPLEIIFEDAHLLAVNKPPGMVVHPGAGTGGDTLVHALLAHCKGGLSGVGGVERPGIVHRLDRETSGVILAAKSDAAHRGLAGQFADRTVRKEYLAIVSGTPRLRSGSIRSAIGRDPRRRHRMAVVSTAAGGRAAHTDWEVVEQFGVGAALVRCLLHTGRTHQIRVHMKALGNPLLGDALYGYKQDPGLPRAPRVMLHAEHLAFTHPITGEPLDLRAAPPGDFETQIAKLRSSAR